MADRTAYISYSQVTTWLDCQWQWLLTRKYDTPELPAWWFVGGSAIHSATETYDKHLFETEGR
jgi:hypothetical protein